MKSGALAPIRHRTVGLKHKTHRRRHGAGDSRRRSDHRLHLAEMGDQMSQRADRRHDQHKEDVAPRSEAARQRGAERDQPSQVETEMHKIGVNERVSEKGPKIGGESAGKCARDADIGAIARRDERKGQKKIDVLVVRQHKHAEGMNENKNADGRHDDDRHIENGLANWGFGFGLRRHRSCLV